MELRDATGNPEDPVPRGPGNFFTPQFPGKIEFSTPHSPRSTPLFPEDPEKACFMIFNFFVCKKMIPKLGHLKNSSKLETNLFNSFSNP